MLIILYTAKPIST